MLHKLALGAAQLGSKYGIANKTGQPSQEDASNIILSALSLGIKHIDTARAYGNSEAVIGTALENVDRSNITISTKTSPSILENTDSEKTIFSAVDKSINESLSALQTKNLAIVMLHRWEHFSEKNGAIWKRLLYWKNKGIVKKLGASLTSPEELIQALSHREIEFIQIPFNILDWRFRTDNIIKVIAKRPDVIIQARSAFLQGLLVSNAEIWPKIPALDAGLLINQLEKLVIDFKRQNRADLCCAYLRSIAWVYNIVIGMETVKQVENNIELFKQPLLSQMQIDIIEKAFVNIPETLLNPSLWK